MKRWPIMRSERRLGKARDVITHFNLWIPPKHRKLNSTDFYVLISTSWSLTREKRQRVHSVSLTWMYSTFHAIPYPSAARHFIFLLFFIKLGTRCHILLLHEKKPHWKPLIWKTLEPTLAWFSWKTCSPSFCSGGSTCSHQTGSAWFHLVPPCCPFLCICVCFLQCVCVCVTFPGKWSAVLASIATFIAHNFLLWSHTAQHIHQVGGGGGEELVHPFMCSIYLCLMRGGLLISTKQARLMSGSGLVPFRLTPSPTTHSH